MKKAFSIIELIFVLTVSTILLIVAAPKVKNIFTKANIAQIQTTISLIREGILQEKNRLLLSNSLESLSTLDDGGTLLFQKILSSAIQESKTPKANGWIRVSNNRYKVYLDTTQFVLFAYDPNKYTFDCNFNDPLCKELSY